MNLIKPASRVLHRYMVRLDGNFFKRNLFLLQEKVDRVKFCMYTTFAVKYEFYVKELIWHGKIEYNTGTKNYYSTTCFVKDSRAQYCDDRTIKQDVPKRKQSLKKTRYLFSQLTNNDLRKILHPLIKCHPALPLDQKQLQHLDVEYCKIVDDLSYNEIVASLLLLHNLLKKEVLKLNLYEESLKTLKLLVNNATDNIVDTDTVAELMKIFTFRMEKEVEVARLLLKHVNISSLSKKDLFIILNSAFKEHITLTQKQLSHVSCMLETESQDIVNNEQILVTLCKVIRQAAQTTIHSFEHLSTAIISRKEIYNLSACAHTLTFYAEMNLMYPKVIERLVSDALQHYSQECNKSSNSVDHHPQVKASYVHKYQYLDDILWATSKLRYDYKQHEFHIIKKFIQMKLLDLYKKPIILSNIILNLWMLNYKLDEELNMCFNENVFIPIARENILWKPKARLYLLVNCVKIELPELKVPDELQYTISVGTLVPQMVQTICNIVNDFSLQMKLRDVKIDCPIKGIFINGVSFTHILFGNVHIDVLDDSHRLLPAGKPNGLVNLKIRLLKKLGYHSIIIDGNSLQSFEHTVAVVETCLANINH